MKTPISKEKEQKRETKPMPPTNSDNSNAEFIVFKRKKKHPNAIEKLDSPINPRFRSQIITIQDETADEGNTQQPTIMILSGTPINRSTKVEEIVQSITVEANVQSPVSTSSQVSNQQSIFSKYKEIELKNEALKASTYFEFWKKTTMPQHRLLYAFDAEKG